MELFSDNNWTRWEPEVVPGEEDRWFFEHVDSNYWYGFCEAYGCFTPLFVFIYWISIYQTKEFMKDRKSIKNLTPIIVAYNVAVALFSITFLYRTIPFLMRIVNQPDWFYRSICHRAPINTKYLFWTIAVGWSKFIHLMDTFFLILKKKPLPFFHLYHHSALLLVPSLTIAYGEPIIFWNGYVNLFQHSIFYPFLAAKALKWKVPKIISTTVLLTELGQMAICLFIGLYSLHAKREGEDCIRHPVSIIIYNFLYSSMLILVLKMTVDYFNKQQPTKQKRI